MVARLESIKDISCVLEKLEGLSYTTIAYDKNSGFVYRKGLNSYTELSRDIKSVKSACKFTNQIKISYGSSNNNL